MANYDTVQTLSFLNTVDLTGQNYKFADILTSDTVTVMAATNRPAVGVIWEGGPAGTVTNVAFSGKVKVIAAGTIAAGANVASNASGLAVTAATGNYIQGKATISAVAGDVFELELFSAGISA